MKLAESYIDLYVFSIKLVPYGREGYFHFFVCLSILFIMFKVQFQYLLYPVVYTHTHTHIYLWCQVFVLYCWTTSRVFSPVFTKLEVNL